MATLISTVKTGQPASCDKTTFVKKAQVSMEGISHEEHHGNGFIWFC